MPSIAEILFISPLMVSGRFAILLSAPRVGRLLFFSRNSYKAEHSFVLAMPVIRKRSIECVSLFICIMDFVTPKPSSTMNDNEVTFPFIEGT